MRQLEAIIRLSEAIAKIHLQSVVKPQHVEEAHRLFKVSTLHAAQSGMSSQNIETPVELMPLIRKVEEAIKRYHVKHYTDPWKNLKNNLINARRDILVTTS